MPRKWKKTKIGRDKETCYFLDLILYVKQTCQIEQLEKSAVLFHPKSGIEQSKLTVSKRIQWNSAHKCKNKQFTDKNVSKKNPKCSK